MGTHQKIQLIKGCILRAILDVKLTVVTERQLTDWCADWGADWGTNRGPNRRTC